MKPSQIPMILDIAVEAKKNGDNFTPLFTGEAGLGKSEIVQQWVKKQKERNPEFFFLDLRLAYMEAPDIIGFPKEVQDEKKAWRTVHCVPEFWPTDLNTEGLILLEEPNRGTTGVMNCLMQILTDGKVHMLDLPPKIVIAGCINPDSSEYDVNNMDAALKDRFEEFEIEHDHIGFASYIEESKWHPNTQRFVNSGIWIYKTTSELADDARYISPRTWSKVNAAEKANAHSDRVAHRIIVTSILGKEIGTEYHKFCYDQAPVTAQDILKGKKKAYERLTEHSNPETYKGDMIAQTVESIVANYGGLKEDCKKTQIDEATMAEVAKIIPADQAVNLIKECGFKQSKGNLIPFFREFTKKYPEVRDVLRDNIKIIRAIK